MNKLQPIYQFMIYFIVSLVVGFFFINIIGNDFIVTFIYAVVIGFFAVKDAY